jgi:hypothetical protein
MPYIVHPDKVATIEALVTAGKAGALNKKAKKPTGKRPGQQAPAFDATLVGRLAQQLFLKRLQTMQGKL